MAGPNPNDTFTMLRSLAILSLAAALSGCATVKNGYRQQVSVESMPPGAQVVANDKVLGQTPLKVKLPRRESHNLTVSKEGFAPQVVTVNPRPNAAAAAFVRFGLDHATGALYDLAPDRLQVNLQPTFMTARTGGNRFEEMAAKAALIDEMRDRGEVGPQTHSYLIGELIKAYGPR
jgi:hypothetical protein